MRICIKIPSFLRFPSFDQNFVLHFIQMVDNLKKKAIRISPRKKEVSVHVPSSHSPSLSVLPALIVEDWRVCQGLVTNSIFFCLLLTWNDMAPFKCLQPHLVCCFLNFRDNKNLDYDVNLIWSLIVKSQQKKIVSDQTWVCLDLGALSALLLPSLQTREVDSGGFVVAKSLPEDDVVGLEPNAALKCRTSPSFTKAFLVLTKSIPTLMERNMRVTSTEQKVTDSWSSIRNLRPDDIVVLTEEIGLSVTVVARMSR